MNQILDHQQKTTRLVELDWLRVLVFGLLIFYHTGMLYVEGWGFHYKSAYSSEFLANIMLWSNQWRMSLLFFISGAALSFLLQKHPGPSFIKRRVPLLFWPWIFGMLVVVVPQVYLEANSKNLIPVTNYWHFWYLYLDQTSAEFAPHKTLGKMHLTWNHLWFLPYLLAYSLIIWSVNSLLKQNVVQNFFAAIAKKINRPAAIIFPVIGFYLIGYFLYKDHPVTHNFVDDWFNQARSFFAFLLGFAFVKMPDLWKQLKTLRWFLLAMSCCTYAYCVFAFQGESLGDSFIAKEINGLIWSANLWWWLLTVVSWAQYWFKKSNPVLDYLNRGVFCFYVLHQTLIIIFAYWLTPLELGPVWEPILLIILVTGLCITLYEVIKRLPLIRICFGVQS